MKRIVTTYFLPATIIFLLGSCVKKNDLKDEMSQTFSIPLGEKELKIDAPTIIDNQSNFYYNGRPYKLIGSNFTKSEILDFEIDSISKDNIIEGADFKIKLENSYPAHAFVQIYLLNEAKLITDSFFVAGRIKIKAGEVNSLAEPEVISSSVTDVAFHGERLEKLKAAQYLKYVFYLDTKREDGTNLRFTDDSKIEINLAMRLYLKYKLSEI